jgi:hypothetical protein
VSAPAVVLDRDRASQSDARAAVPPLAEWLDRTPVMVEDVISTARTMIDTVVHLRAAGLAPPGVHALFASGSDGELVTAGAGRLVTCDTIPHLSNQVALSHALADGVRRCLRHPAAGSLGPGAVRPSRPAHDGSSGPLHHGPDLQSHPEPVRARSRRCGGASESRERAARPCFREAETLL